MVEPVGTQALLRILKTGHVFFDIGANVGYYALLASQRVGPTGRVLAFEPSTRNISYLYRHLALNRAHNVTVIPVACFDRSAIVRFVAGANCATGRLAETSSQSPQDGAEYVAAVAIDEVVAQIGLVPDVIKIDVEGAEDVVLRGASNTLAATQPIVFLSVHSELLRVSCTAQLRALGYGEPTMIEEPGGGAELLFLSTTGVEQPRSS